MIKILILIGMAILYIATMTYIKFKYNKLNKRHDVAEAFINKPEPELLSSQITHDRLLDFEEQLDGLPNKVLESINGSISNHKGKLAELIAYVNLKASYDKVIPLGNIVDFLGIRFPTDTDPGTFDFIDIKNGKSARLSQDQKQLQKLIQGQRIQFLKIQITTDNVTDLPNTGSDPGVQ